MKKYLIIILAVVVVAVGIYFLLPSNDVDLNDQPEQEETSTSTEEEIPSEEEVSEENETESVIGSSAAGNDIMAYTYGDGSTELLFVGGFHGGYEWNTVLVAYELIDYLEENPGNIPSNIKVTVIPVLNPDGLEEVTGSTGRFSRADVPTSQEDTIPGRFNANGVDLNRNFDCDWQSTATWQNRSVDGGDSVFSEPEARALRDYVNSNRPDGVVVWYSAANGVFASSCHNGVLEETLTMTNIYSEASGYPAYEEFNFYEITGDAVNWLAKEEIPAISVLLSTHQDVEWNKNRAGIEALLEYFSE